MPSHLEPTRQYPTSRLSASLQKTWPGFVESKPLPRSGVVTALEEERPCRAQDDADIVFFVMNDSAKQKSPARIAVGSVLAATLCAGTVLAGDGSGEAGFVAPPRDRKPPPAPPRDAASAESLLACCCCPVAPMSRTETKKPPRPPVLVTKLKDNSASR